MTLNPMKERPILPLLLSMAVPVMLSMLIQSLYNIVDSLWVAQLGTDAITAVSLAFPLQNVILSAGVGMGIGVGSVISMSLGAGDQKTADQAASQGLFLVCLHCVFFLAAGIFVTKPFLSLFTQDQTVLSLSCSYTYIVLCFSFGSLLQMCLEKIFQGVGRMKTTMCLMASGCLINIVLDPLFIFGWFGFPALGVTGAAVATVIGQIAAFFLYLVVYRRGTIGVSIRWNEMRPRRALAVRIYSIGIPSALMLAMPSALVGILNGMLGALDQVYVAVFGLYFKLQSFVNMPSSGLVQGMRPIISYNYGAGEMDRVRRTIRYSMGLTAFIMLVGTVAAVGFPRQLLRAFAAEPQLMEYGVPALRIIGLSFLVSSVGIVSAGVFEALGRGRESLAITLLRQLVIIVPLGWLLSGPLGAVGIWLAFPIAETVAAAVSLWLLRRREVRKRPKERS